MANEIFDRTEQPLSGLTCTASFLDNQWAPLELQRALSSNTLALDAFSAKKSAAQHQALLHALLTSKHVIVNRAYLRNNEMLQRHIEQSSPQVAELLRSQAIIPYLLNERTADEDAAAFATLPDSAKNWSRVYRASDRPPAIRLSTDDLVNKQSLRDMSSRFQNFCIALCERDADLDFITFDPVTYKYAPQAAHELRKLYALIAEEARNTAELTREIVYKRLFGHRHSPEGAFFANASERVCKQVIDLKYNYNLPDALNAYALMGPGALNRPALRESELSENAGTFRPEDIALALVNLARLAAFGEVRYIDLTKLKLQDIVSARQRPIWTEFISSAETLLSSDGDSLTAHPLLHDDAFEHLRELFSGVCRDIAYEKHVRQPARDAHVITKFVVEFAGDSVKATIEAGKDSDNSALKLMCFCWETSKEAITETAGHIVAYCVLEIQRATFERTSMKIPVARLSSQSVLDDFRRTQRLLEHEFRGAWDEPGRAATATLGPDQKDKDI